MKKKLMAVLLAAVMTVGSLAGCGGQEQSGDSAPEQTTSEETGVETAAESTEGEQNELETENAETKPFKYGFISWGTADEHGRTLNAAVKWAVDAAGGEFVMDGSAITAESTVAAAENLIQSGCDMISFCTYAGEASVPQISKLWRTAYTGPCGIPVLRTVISRQCWRMILIMWVLPVKIITRPVMIR